MTNSNNPSHQDPTLFPISAKPQTPPPQRRQLDDPSASFITRIVQTVTLVHYIDGDGNLRGISTFHSDPQTVLADPVTGDVISSVGEAPPVAPNNPAAAAGAAAGAAPADGSDRDSNDPPRNPGAPADAAAAAAAAAAGNAQAANGNPPGSDDDAAPVGEDPGAINRDPPGDAVVPVAPPPGDAVVEVAPPPGVPEAPEPGAPETVEGPAAASPAPEGPVAPGDQQPPEATAPPPAATDTDSRANTALTGTSEDQTQLSSALSSSGFPLNVDARVQ